MAQALRATGKTTKKEVVEAGLKLLVQLQKQTLIQRSRGKLEFYPDVLEERKRHDIEGD